MGDPASTLGHAAYTASRRFHMRLEPYNDDHLPPVSDAERRTIALEWHAALNGYAQAITDGRIGPGDDLLTAKGAADLLGYHPVTVRKMAREGTLPARKVGKEWRFVRSQLLAFIQGAL